MKHKICLHGINVKNKGQLLDAVKKILPLAAEKTRQKEKYLPDNDMLKYSSYKFSVPGSKDYKVICLSGIMVVSDRLLPVNDVVIEYDNRGLPAVQRILKKLLGGKLHFVLEEPDLLLRLQQQRGRFKIEELPLYDEDSVATVLNCHLPVQVYNVSKLWGVFLQQPGEKPSVRQLRVKLRRLRSSLALFKPLLPEAKLLYWKAEFKKWTDMLGGAREYDVALMTCMKIRRSRQEDAEQPLELEQLLQERRQRQAKKVLHLSSINAMTAALLDFLLMLYSLPLNKEMRQLRLRSFLRQRLSAWCDKLLLLPERYPDVEDMEQLHKIRIKIKRFRYALQAAPEITVTPVLLRRLKNLQDMLGLLHDNYINDQLIEDIVAANKDNAELRCEGAMFRGWDSARSEAVLTSLPEIWEDFSCCLQEWQEEYL